MKRMTWLLLGLLSFTAWGLELEYDYHLSGYPNPAGDCDATGKVASEQFAQAARVPLVRVTLRPSNDPQRCNLTFRYRAERKVREETTYRPSLGMLATSDQGTYRTLAECQSDLPAQKEVFENATRLPTTFSYCFQEPDVLGELGSNLPFALVVSGFGISERHHYVFYEDLDALEGSDGARENAIRQALEQQGIPVAQVAIRRAVLGFASTLNIRYYAPEKLTLEMWANWVQTDTQCQQQLAQARTLFRRIGEPELLSHCRRSVAGASYPGVLLLRVRRPKGNGLRTPKKSYPTFSQCIADEPQVFEAFHHQENWEPFGALCGITWDGIQMSVFGPPLAQP